MYPEIHRLRFVLGGRLAITLLVISGMLMLGVTNASSAMVSHRFTDINPGQQRQPVQLHPGRRRPLLHGQRRPARQRDPASARRQDRMVADVNPGKHGSNRAT